MEFSSSDKATILLNLLDRQIDEIQRREQREQQWFEWSTSLLLGAFAAAVALSGNVPNMQYPILVKVLASILTAVPTLLSIPRILRQSRFSVTNAETVERIQDLLYLFDDDYYGTHSPYPKAWVGRLAEGRLKRKTPIYYSVILALMAACVITAFWFLW